ncbi:hypothetical protein [Candidatus Odyssella acanthamoebae]|uniref:F-box domain-containing protein n=1 Tax=Candidatus Odyssella acanthamoebae TaxID=91604 RepID=A0A077AX68_9PROT|nr:hypothetical protein [Candidatus Paracaedibacter acanthamoebae]AIK96574.1 hypothetical protein ID47_07325 [Candidatus Paracaedibacter acanthamoebae]
MENNYKKIKKKIGILLLLSILNLCWQGTALAMDKRAADHAYCDQQGQLLLNKQGVMDNDATSETSVVETLVVGLGTSLLLVRKDPNNLQSSNAAESDPLLFKRLPAEINFYIFQFLKSYYAKQAALVSSFFYNFVNSTRNHLKLKCSITDENLIKLVKKYPNITSLNLEECEELTDVALLTVAKMCPNLTSLNLLGCRKVTAVALIKVAEMCPKLPPLDPRKCQVITMAAIRRVAEECPV